MHWHRRGKSLRDQGFRTVAQPRSLSAYQDFIADNIYAVSSSKTQTWKSHSYSRNRTDLYRNSLRPTDIHELRVLD